MEGNKIKKFFYNAYYTAQVGNGIWGWLLSLVAYTSIVVIAVHLVLPSLSIKSISVIVPVAAFVLFYITGHFALKHRFYSSSQTFGGRMNPNRLNWELELSKAKLTLAQNEIIMRLAKQMQVETKNLEEYGKQMKEVQDAMEAMLKQ